MKHFAIIFAKKGSKGLPGKNMATVYGSSLLSHTVENLKISNVFEEIFLSTNSNELINEAEDLGLSVIRRPDHLAKNENFVKSVYYTIEKLLYKPEIVTIPQIVIPIREKGIFNRIAEIHKENWGKIDSIVTVKKLEGSLSWFYKRDEKNILHKIDSIKYEFDIGRRDDIFEIDNAIVSFTYKSFQKSKGITSWPYLGKNIFAIQQKLPNKNYFVDINTKDDLEWFEFLLTYEEWKENRK